MRIFLACAVALFAFVACASDEATERTPTQDVTAADSAELELARANVESGLRNTATVEEAYFVDNMKYTKSLTELRELGLALPEGVTVKVEEISSDGYCITGTHPLVEETYAYESSSVEVVEGDC